MTNEPVKTLVLGLGNVLMGDEGIGVYVVREIEKHTLPAGVECLDGGTGGFTLLEPLEDADRIIIIDAASDGNPIGTVSRTTPQFSRDYPPTLTACSVSVHALQVVIRTSFTSQDRVIDFELRVMGCRGGLWACRISAWSLWFAPAVARA